MDSQVFKYNGNEICFQTGDGSVMVNATEMARPFGKLPADFLKTQRAQEYVRGLSVMKNIITDDLVIVTQGGFNQGTWMHEDVALEFARWLSPAFAIWCNDRIKELLKYGITATTVTIDKILADPSNAIKLLTALENERTKNKQLESENNIKEKRLQLQEHEIKQAAPKVLFADCVTGSNTDILIRDLAKLITQNEHVIGQDRLYDWMVENKYLIRRQRWSKSKEKYLYDYMPTQRAAELGVFFVHEHVQSRGDSTFMTHTVKVTGKGQVYFMNKFLYQNNNTVK